MIPVGYMAKQVSSRPEWFPAEQVEDIYSVSGCISRAFADYIGDWRHNGYWFFDAPEIIQQLAQEKAIDLSETTLFYYEVYELEFEEMQGQWMPFVPEPSFPLQVMAPTHKTLVGYDVVAFSMGNVPECSPLSCNGLAAEVETNTHCLLDSFKQAQNLLENGVFTHSEPGPYRIFAVYRVAWS